MTSIEKSFFKSNVQMIILNWKETYSIKDVNEALVKTGENSFVYVGFKTGNDSVLTVIGPAGIDQNQDIGEDLALCWGSCVEAHWDAANGFWFLMEDIGRVEKWLPLQEAKNWA